MRDAIVGDNNSHVTPLLEVQSLTVHYEGVKAVHKVSFYLNTGEIVVVIGANGAGKSTALKAVSGVLQASGGNIETGEVLFEGRSIKGSRTDTLVKLGISLIPEGRRIFSTMSVRENLEMGAYTRRDKAAVGEDIGRILDFFPPLRGRAAQKAGTLSSGEQQMLAIARALMLRPKVLLADEPSLGLSPNFVEFIFDKFVEINKDGTSLLIVEQNAATALDICDRAYVFENGSIVLGGDRDQIIRNPEVKNAFLGG